MKNKEKMPKGQAADQAAENPAPEEAVVQQDPAELAAEVERLTTELEIAATEAEKLNDLLLRTAAEYDNYRKRTQKEKETAFGDAKASAIAAFLPVLDNLERAASVEGSLEDLKKGIELTGRQFLDALTKLGVEEIATEGESFNPDMHNAVMHEDDDTFGESTVMECFQKGYRMGDRVIRHSMVKVAN